ncbi:hypothetical protein J4218_00245 [Candidatus Pacearchaeota archaeon]|nr:hypothetical protein [Candidatus Pacearchaeota archaeon]
MKKKIEKKSGYSKHRIDGIVTLVASLLVLFSSMIDPLLSVIIALLFLVSYSIFKIFIDKR